MSYIINFNSKSRQNYLWSGFIAFVLMFSVHPESAFASRPSDRTVYLSMDEFDGLALSAPANKTEHRFESTQEVNEYTRRIEESCSAHDFKNTFSLTNKIFVFPSVNITIMSMENFHFWNYYAQAQGAYSKAKTNSKKLNFYKTQIYYLKAIQSMESYKDECWNFESKRPQCNLLMFKHRGDFMKLLAELRQSHFHDRNERDYQVDLEANDGLRKWYSEAIKQCSNQINIAFYNPIIVTIWNAEMQQAIENSVCETVSLYCAQTRLAPTIEEKKKIYLKALMNKQSLQSNELKSTAQKHLEFALENMKLYETLASKRIPPKIKEIKQQHIDKQFKELDSSLQNNNIFNDISINFLELNDLLSKAKQKDDYIVIRQAIIDLEARISESLTSVTTTVNKDIYKAIFHSLGDRALISDLPCCVFAFAEAGDADGALERLEILKYWQERMFAKEVHQNRIFRASLMNLKGDHTEWLAIEKENCIVKEEKIKIKEEEKKQQNSKHASYIKEQKKQREQQKIQEVKQHEKKQKDTVRKTVNTNTAIDVPVNDLPQVNFKEEQQQKLQRHKAAEEQRSLKELAAKTNTEKKVQAHSQSLTTSISSQGDIETDTVDAINLQLKTLYNLPTNPSKVDDFIEDGTWKFTREECRHYLEAMGCVYKPGSTNHQKVNLPKCIHVMLGDELITIFNEFGGAAVLPEWDTTTVPHYLRPQIQAVRLKLHALAMKAKKAGSK